MESSATKFTSAFLDAPWIVAAFLGVWGVMIGLEDFLLADVLFVAAGVLVCVKIARETNLRQKERRLWIFIAAFVCVMVFIGLDLRWTNRKAEEAANRKEQLSHLGEIPGLKGDLKTMRENQEAEKISAALSQAQADQKLDDIEEENKDLRKSVETKDAALVKIAKDQYALNFFPQVVISTNGRRDELIVQNNGKTNIVTYKMNLEGIDIADASLLSTISPTASNSYKMPETSLSVVVAHATPANARVPVEGTLYLSTLDNRRYSMAFTWFFEVKDGRVDKSYIEDHSITEVLETKLK
jgi:hypothetical protein